jgi:triosephosphate isomerase
MKINKMKPIILVNFKTYKEATGKNALKLAMECEAIAKKKGAKMILCVQAADISTIAKSVSLPVFAQHVDYFEQSRNTGFILPEDVKQEGAKGTLINHSEHRIPFKQIEKTVERCGKTGLRTVVCAATLEEAEKILKLKPYSIMFEDPALVSTGKSITKIEPKSVRNFAERIKKSKSRVISLCGAGISSGEDVRLAMQLGCDGVGIASAIVKAKNRKEKIKEIISP